MSELFDIGHEVDLSEYDLTVTDGGDLSQGSPGLAGTSGRMECLIDDSTSIVGFAYIASPSIVRCRYYIDPNTLTMANNDAFVHHRYQQRAGAYGILIDIHLRWLTATGFRLIAECLHDNDTNAFWDTFDISDLEHYVEYKIVRATNATSNDGTFEWWVGGVSQGSISNWDNFNKMGDENCRSALGAISGIDYPGTQGTFYLDELKGNDDGGEIGPVAAEDLNIDIGMDESAYQGTGVRIIS